MIFFTYQSVDLFICVNNYIHNYMYNCIYTHISACLYLSIYLSIQLFIFFRRPMIHFIVSAILFLYFSLIISTHSFIIFLSLRLSLFLPPPLSLSLSPLFVFLSLFALRPHRTPYYSFPKAHLKNKNNYGRIVINKCVNRIYPISLKKINRSSDKVTIHNDHHHHYHYNFNMTHGPKQHQPNTNRWMACREEILRFSQTYKLQRKNSIVEATE